MPSMSQDPRVPHRCLKALRKACQMTQRQLAEKIGVSKNSISSLEVGRAKLSRAMAMRIWRVTGADPLSLLDPRGEPTYNRQPYTFESYRQHHSVNVLKGELPPEMSAWGHTAIDTLLHAAAAKGRLHAVSHVIGEFITKTLFDFDLGSNVVDRLMASSNDDFRQSWNAIRGWISMGREYAETEKDFRAQLDLTLSLYERTAQRTKERDDELLFTIQKKIEPKLLLDFLKKHPSPPPRRAKTKRRVVKSTQPKTPQLFVVTG
jgi:DNA-binding XRE family transcriptional regulator